MRQQEQPSRSSGFLDECCALLFTVLRFPQTANADHTVPAVRERVPPLSLGGLASLMLGISLSLILSGLITFMIGCMMMPWVLGLVMLLYFIGLLSSISMLWKVVQGLTSSSSPSRSSQKGISEFMITSQFVRVFIHAASLWAISLRGVLYYLLPLATPLNAQLMIQPPKYREP